MRFAGLKTFTRRLPRQHREALRSTEVLTHPPLVVDALVRQSTVR